MQRVRFVEQLDDATRKALLDAGPTQEIPDGGYLLHDGDDANCVFLVVDGLLKIVKTSVDGQVTFLGFRRSGTLVGELAILSSTTRSSSMQAVGPARVVRIGADNFEYLLAHSPDLSRALLETLAVRLREATAHIHDLMTANAATRMASRLVQLVDDTLEHVDDSTVMSLPVSQQELGEWAGLSRAGAVKALREMRDLGVITTSRMTISIIDLPRLRAMAVT